jgi:hypothetical protein
MRSGATAKRGRLAPAAPGGFFTGFSLSCTESLEPSSCEPLRPATAAFAAFSVAISTNP